jgi:hypothetical protein
LAMTLNIDKTHITHSTSEKALFLGYEISCTPKSKMPIGYNSRKRLVRKTTRTIMNAPIKRVVERLRLKGFLNSKNQPTRCGRYINMDLWNIIDSYKSIERGVLNYYSMANNYGRLSARVHYSLKYSCALTISSKMKLRTMRGSFKRYGKNLEIKVRDKLISYSNISFKRPRNPIARLDASSSFENYFESLVYSHERQEGNFTGPCIICGSPDNVEAHHIISFENIKKRLSMAVGKFTRKQVPVCKSCHIKVPKGILFMTEKEYKIITVVLLLTNVICLITVLVLIGEINLLQENLSDMTDIVRILDDKISRIEVVQEETLQSEKRIEKGNGYILGGAFTIIGVIALIYFGGIAKVALGKALNLSSSLM